MPANLSREDLLAVLDEIRNGVASGDTLEGSIEFLLNYNDELPQPYDVRAGYRIDNLQGQGGMRMIGHSAPGAPDNRRRVWVDGTGHAWIDTCVDGSTEYVGELAGALDMGKPIETVRAERKGLRLLGVTW